MSATLFSRDWYRVADLKPKLKQWVQVHPHRYRRQRWYVLSDQTTGQVRRLRPEAWRLVGLMDGERSLDEIWRRGAEVLAERLPSHEELLSLVASLYQANLIRVDAPGEAAELLKRNEEFQVKRWLGRLKSPLSIQIPLLDPDAFLAATERWVRPLFSPAALILWCVAMVYLLVQTATHWDALTGNLADRVLAAENLVLLFLIYPCIKLLHELGHGYAVKRGGGEVHEMGIMLLVFFPMPYVDASATASFADRRQRVVVGAIGMMIELAIAAVAMMVWLAAEPGLIRSLAFNVIFLAGISAVLFNGNPLLRFDAYYMLADSLEIPNLGQRSNAYWGYLAKRYLFGMNYQTPPGDSFSERVWLGAYGILAFAYRLFISITIVLFVAQSYPAIGALIGVWTVSTVWLWPIGKVLTKPFTEPEFKARGRPAWLIYGLSVGVLIILLAVLPMPLSTTVEGVVIPRETAQVVAGERCTVRSVGAQSGSVVRKGDPLIVCDPLELDARLRILEAEQQALAAQRREAFEDPVRAKVVDEELARINEELQVTQARRAALTIQAPVSGTFLLPRASDTIGRYLERGAVVGQVVRPELVGVRGMLPEPDIDLVRQRTREVVLYRAGHRAAHFSVQNYTLTPAASHALVSEVLAEMGGGTAVLDATGERTVGRYFVVDLQPEAAFGQAVSMQERVFIEFEHYPEPLVWRFVRTVRRTFLDVFDV